MKIEYVSTETFTNELINAIREDRMAEFRERYRSVDLLLVDDIQFIAGKERTQEEFFHTFNALYEAHKQIILSSDRPPKDILTLEARLRSRFEWGLITDIQPPDLETRIAILKMNAEQRGLRIGEEVLEYIARQVTSNIRELEGALMRAIAYASLNGVELTRSVAAKALSDIFAPREVEVDPQEIVRKVAEHFALRPEDLLGGVAGGRRWCFPARSPCTWCGSSPAPPCPRSASSSAAATTPRSSTPSRRSRSSPRATGRSRGS